MPKLRIEEAAALRQARIDRGDEVIVGVNKYRPEEETQGDLLDIDNTAVRDAQIKRLKQVRAGRDEAQCQAALAALKKAAEDDRGSLLECAIDAAKARASVGEISVTLEDVFQRHRAETLSISGVYGAAYADDAEFNAIVKTPNSCSIG